MDIAAVGEEFDGAVVVYIEAANHMGAVDHIELVEQIPYSAELPRSTYLQSWHGSAVRVL